MREGKILEDEKGRIAILPCGEVKIEIKADAFGGMKTVTVIGALTMKKLIELFKERERGGE